MTARTTSSAAGVDLPPKPDLAAATESALTERVGRRRQRFRNGSLLAGVGILAVVVLFVALYPLVSPYSPTEPDFNQPTFAGPSG